MVVWWSYYAGWTPLSCPEVVGLLPHIKYIPLFGNPLPLCFFSSPLWHLSSHFSLANRFLWENTFENNLWQGGLGRCYVTGQDSDNSFPCRIFHKHPENKEPLWILFILLIEFCGAVALWVHAPERAHKHTTTCSQQTHKLKHKLRRLLINFVAEKRDERESGLWRSGEGLMESREVQARWLKTQATDVSGALQSGAPASASAGHDALLRWCPPGTWRWHHIPGPPGKHASHVGDTVGHTSPQQPSSQRDEGHQGKRHTCSTPTSKAPNWGMCSL